MKALICPSAVNSSNLGLTGRDRDENAHRGGMAGWNEIAARWRDWKSLFWTLNAD